MMGEKTVKLTVDTSELTAAIADADAALGALRDAMQRLSHANINVGAVPVGDCEGLDNG